MIVTTSNVSQSPGFAKYQGLIRTAESNFKKVPRPVSIWSVYDCIRVVPDRAPDQFSLGSHNNATDLFKFHNGIRDVGFPTDDAIPEGYGHTVQRQPRAQREVPRALFNSSGFEAPGCQTLVRGFHLTGISVRSDEYVVGTHPKMAPLSDDCVEPKSLQFLRGLVGPQSFFEFTDFEISLGR